MIYSLKILASGILLLFVSISPKHQQSNTVEGNHITVEKLSKKWQLSNYKYLIFSEEPSEKEKNDFLHFSSDMTYTSISEGVFEKGEWTLDKEQKKMHLNAMEKDGVLTFFIDKLSSNQLVLIIDDPTDKEAKNLKIIFKNK